MTSSVQELYGEIWGRDETEFEAAIASGPKPRGADVLYDIFGQFNVKPNDLVLDAGCRYATYAIELVKRFGCRALAIDPVPLHIEKAKRNVTDADLTAQIRVEEARLEALPADDESIDHIWCRDVLNHVDLPRSLAECFRVLKPGGAMMVYQTFGTDLCEPREAARLYQSMSIVPENMNTSYFESVARDTGFHVAEKDVIGSEWREGWLEEGDQTLMQDLLRVARLRRRENQLVEEYGRTRFEASYGNSLWGIYQMLGKLQPTVYIIRK